MDVPIATVSFVQSDKQIFAAVRGFPVGQVPRELGVTSRLLHSDALLHIQDMKLDPGFRNNRFVFGPPFIRSYVGAPIVVKPGFGIGAVTALDIKPRSITTSEIRFMRSVAAAVAGEVEKAVQQYLN